MARPILIDADPGQDDAVAILLALASPEDLEVLAITTVAGNVPVAATVANALRICDLAGRPDLPVHAGADRPLICELETAEFVCGPDGLAGVDLPPPSRAPDPGHAVDALIGALRAPRAEKVTICALGPLTNLALALRLAPDIAARIERIVVMGGAQNLGNMTPAAEFNIYVDPHAAGIVFGAGLPITMFGLQVTLSAIASAEAIAAISHSPHPVLKAVHGIVTRPRPGGLGSVGHPLHDVCVIAWLLWPELFAGRDCHVDVETGAGPLRGRTTIDWNDRLNAAPNAHVIGAMDAGKFYENLFARLGGD